MNEVIEAKDFDVKFRELNSDNQKYIIAIQQALMFAQSNEKAVQETKCDRVS